MAERIVDNDGDILDINSDGSISTGGGVAAGATDSGNPVKIGGKYNSTKPTLSDGQRGDVQLTTRGSVLTTIAGTDSATAALVAAAADGLTGGANAGLLVIDFPMTINGQGSWDRFRGNQELTHLASAARTATTNGADTVNYNGRGVNLTLNVTANPGGAETLSLKLQGKDFASNTYYDIADAGVLFTAANGIQGFQVYPGIIDADLATGMTGKSAVLPRTWRAVVTHSSTGSWTYSVSSVVLL